MAYAREIMQGGFSAGSARSVQGQTKTAISAAGTVSTDATTLVASANVISTAAANSGVILSDGEINDSVIVYNGGLNTVKVYPPSGDNFNQLAANAAFSLAINTAAMAVKLSSSQWAVFVSA